MLFDLMYVKMAFNIKIKKNSQYKPNWKLPILMLNKVAKILIGRKNLYGRQPILASFYCIKISSFIICMKL